MPLTLLEKGECLPWVANGHWLPPVTVSVKDGQNNLVNEYDRISESADQGCEQVNQHLAAAVAGNREPLDGSECPWGKEEAIDGSDP